MLCLSRQMLVRSLVGIALLVGVCTVTPYLHAFGWTLWWIDAVTPAPGMAKVPFPLVEAATQRVLAHKIRRETFYEKACLQLTFEYQHPEACEKILSTGLVLFPHSWRLAFLTGYIHTHFLHHPQQGAYYYRLAASHPDAPPFVQHMGQKNHPVGVQ